MSEWKTDTTERNLGKQPHTCRICGAKGDFDTYKVREMFKGTKDEFIYFACAECNCLQIDEVPENLGDYYGDDYYSYQVDENPNMKFETPVTDHTRILDVGCGNGEWLIQMAKKGYGNLYGCDPFIEKDRHYGDRVKIYKSSIHEMEGDGSFDVVRMGDSFEHMTDPLEALKSAKRLLKQGGLLYMRIPTYPNVAFDIYKAHWFEIDAPRHIFLHSKQSIKWLSKESGLDISSIRYDSGYAQFTVSHCYQYGIPFKDLTNSNYGRFFSKEDIYMLREKTEYYNEHEYGDHMEVFFVKTYVSKSKKSGKVIFQRFPKGTTRRHSPFPPLYRQPDTDYICFTDDEKATSHHWKIHLVSNLEDRDIEPYLAPYKVRWELTPKQIQMGPLPDAYINGDIITVPDIESLPYVKFDKDSMTPTADSDGNYIYRKNPVYREGKYDGRPLLLTIGMPVSNQIGTIERCLSHIKPLLDNLDAELVIVDTGSTDGTLDICKEYDARIIQHPWEDNMSAVRNEALYNAKGEWYMSIDDDEWFEEVDEILQFFSSGEYRGYDAASYIQRNYTDNDGQVWLDFHTPRIIKVIPEVHFEGRIHDSIEFPRPIRLKELHSYAHHYGFVRDDKEKVINKFIRNTSILIYDIYEYPNNPRYLFQFVNEYKSLRDWNLTINLFAMLTAILFEDKFEKDAKLESEGAKCVTELLLCMSDGGDQRLFRWSSLLESLFNLNIVQKAAAAWTKVSLAFRIGKPPEKILENYNSYISIKDEYQKNPGYSRVFSYNGVALLEHKYYIMCADTAAFCALVKIGDEKNALELLSKISLDIAGEWRSFIMIEGFLAGDELYECLCDKLTPMQWEEWVNDILNICAYCLAKDDFYETEAKRLPGVLARLSVSAVLGWVNNVTKTENVQSRLLQYALDFTERNGGLTNSPVQELCLCAWFLKEAYVKGRNDINGTDLLYRYIAVMGAFSEKYYNSDYLLDASSNVIPPDIRAIYRMYVVIADGKASRENIAILKQALEIFPSFHEEIRTILKGLES
jgi:glycosyltransferase involved in cell wall biosynthesis/SAM-dependent methyltransferase